MRHFDSLLKLEQQVTPEIIMFGTSVTAASEQLPVVYANFYGAPNIAASSILDMQMPLTVTVLPNGDFTIDLSELFSYLTNFEKPDDLSDMMSRMFDIALDNPIVTLVGDIEGIQIIGVPGS